MLKSVASLRGCALVWERLLVLGSLSHFHILGLRLADGRASRRGELGRVGAPQALIAASVPSPEIGNPKSGWLLIRRT